MSGKSIVQTVGSIWCKEEACLGNNRPQGQVLVAQMRNQALQKNQDLKYQKSNEKQEQAENRNKEMHDQYFE